MLNSIFQIAPSISLSEAFYGTHLFYARLTKEQIISLCDRVLEEFENDYEFYKEFFSRFVSNHVAELEETLAQLHYTKTICNLKKLKDDAENDRLIPLNVAQYMDLSDIIKTELDYALLFNDGNPLEQTVEAMANFKELAIEPFCYDFI